MEDLDIDAKEDVEIKEISVEVLEKGVSLSEEPPKSYKAIIHRYKKCSEDVQKYFEYLPGLVNDYPLEISIGYLFHRVESMHRMTLYIGVVKLHRANAGLAWPTIQKQELFREDFKIFSETIFKKKIPNNITKKIKEAEEIRDMVMHGIWEGRRPSRQREAIADILEYSEKINIFINSLAKFRPFGDLRGVKGATKAVPKETTRWILKGMGFKLS